MKMFRKNINKSRNPKVTVVMPAYNASTFIEESTQSALIQDYSNFELVIVDDRSTDNTWDIIRRYKYEPRVRVYRNKKHLGSAATRNKIIGIARGEYISPLDADDIMLQGNLRRMSDFLEKHPKFGAVYADLLVLNLDRRKRLRAPPYITQIDVNKGWDLINNTINHGGSMIRKKLILKVGGYDESVCSVDDRSLWLKLSEVASFKYLKGEVYYVWRRHPAGLTQTDKNAKKDTLKIVKEAIKRRYSYELSFR